MTRHSSRLALALILVFALGVGGFWHWRNRPSETANRADASPIGESSGKIPQGFGPIPLAADPGKVGVAPLQQNAEVASHEMRILATRMSRETADLKIVSHPDGRRSVSLEGRFLQMSAVVTGADGKSEVRCYSDFQQMASALQAGPPADSPRPTTDAR